MSGEVDNQYKLALGDALPTLRGKTIICGIGYHEAETALANEAWVGGLSDAFSTALADHHRLGGEDGDAAEGAFDGRYNSEPDKVPADDARAHWS